jgi:putative transposase
MAAVTELATAVGTRAACRALFAPRASYYRERRATSSPAVTPARPGPVPARALRPAERATVLAHLHGERFQDRSPAAVYATLLDEGEYHVPGSRLTRKSCGEALYNFRVADKSSRTS